MKKIIRAAKPTRSLLMIEKILTYKRHFLFLLLSTFCVPLAMTRNFSYAACTAIILGGATLSLFIFFNVSTGGYLRNLKKALRNIENEKKTCARLRMQANDLHLRAEKTEKRSVQIHKMHIEEMPNDITARKEELLAWAEAFEEHFLPISLQQNNDRYLTWNTVRTFYPIRKLCIPILFPKLTGASDYVFRLRPILYYSSGEGLGCTSWDVQEDYREKLSRVRKIYETAAEEMLSIEEVILRYWDSLAECHHRVTKEFLEMFRMEEERLTDVIKSLKKTIDTVPKQHFKKRPLFSMH